jgi:type IV pilus assembly protein PilN
LRKNKSGPAQRLATLSDSTPDQLWLEAYKEAGDTIKIAGLAMNEELIAQFIRALEASADYERVDLLVSEQKDLAGTKLKRFELTLLLERTKPVEATAPAAAAAKK